MYNNSKIQWCEAPTKVTEQEIGRRCIALQRNICHFPKVSPLMDQRNQMIGVLCHKMHVINIVKDIADSLIKFWVLISPYYAMNIFNIFKCINEFNCTFSLMGLI